MTELSRESHHSFLGQSFVFRLGYFGDWIPSAKDGQRIRASNSRLD